MTRCRWSTLSADEANLLACVAAFDDLFCGRITRAEYDQRMAALTQPRHAWGDSWVKVALGAALIVAALAAWLW